MGICNGSQRYTAETEVYQALLEENLLPSEPESISVKATAGLQPDTDRNKAPSCHLQQFAKVQFAVSDSEG
jgi:hypothetical protein